MEGNNGLAATMVYGSGNGQTIKHYYSGSKQPKTTKKKKEK